MHTPDAIAQEAARLLGATVAAPRGDVSQLAAAAAELLGGSVRQSGQSGAGAQASPSPALHAALHDMPTGGSKRPAYEDAPIAQDPPHKVPWLRRLLGKR